jgi:dihydroneopterin triphosphate diphosphatase
MRLPVSAFVFPVSGYRGAWQFLLLKRKPVPTYQLDAFWQGVTGGVEEGESVAQTAYRELLEETSLIPKSIEAIDLVYSYALLPAWRHRYKPEITTITEHVFVALVDSAQEPILSEEHTEFCWCDFDQAYELLEFRENKQALLQCRDYLNRRR